MTPEVDNSMSSIAGKGLGPLSDIIPPGSWVNIEFIEDGCFVGGIRESVVISTQDGYARWIFAHKFKE